MSMLANYIMQQVLGRGGQGDDPALAKENRTAYRQQLQKAYESGDQTRIDALIPQATQAGVDVGPYQSKPPAEAQIGNQFTQMLAETLGIVPKQPQTSAFDRGSNAAINFPGREEERLPEQPTPSTAAMQKLSEIFTPEFSARVVAKKFGGIDVGEHDLTDPQWFKDYAGLPGSMDASTKKEMLAAKYGYIPMQAAQLKDLSLDERKSITQGAFAKFMADPAVDAAFRKSFPGGDDKAKAGVVLHKFVQEGMPIPDQYNELYNRFLNLHDDMVQMKTDEAAQREAATSRARKRVEFEMEAEKPISAEDRAKYGIGAKIPTYTELANQGVRFPTESDRKVYQELSAVRDQIADMQDLLFGGKDTPQNGIFSGIGKDWASRKGAQAMLIKDRATGSQRGQNYEIYSDVLASMARRLLTLAGESGGRFTDKDVEQITRSAPDLGGAISPIDSEDIAKQKFERFIVGLNRRLADVTGNVAITPRGQEAATPAVSEKFEVGKIYRDAQGNRAKYLGEGKWQKTK